MTDGMIGGYGERAPDYTVPFFGYRSWTFGLDGSLRSPFLSDVQWVTPEQRAACLGFNGTTTRHDHKAPQPDCECGFYLYHDLDGRAYSTTRVVGACVATGLIELHEDGMRCERLRVVAFCPPQTEEARKNLNRLLRCKQWRNVEIVPREDLPAYVAEFGEPIPADIIEAIAARNREKREAALKKQKYINAQLAKQQKKDSFARWMGSWGWHG